MGLSRGTSQIDFDNFKAGLSNNFNSARKGLVNFSGIKYQDYLKTLKPNYVTVWRDLLLGYLSLILSVSLLFIIDPHVTWVSGLATLLAAFLIGYSLHYISTFFHCASHHNLAQDHSTNDLLANGLIAPLFGISIQRYRSIHFAHHRNLGTREDTENDYIRPLNTRFFLESFVAWKFARNIIRHMRFSIISDTSAEKKNGLDYPVLAASVCLHLAIIGIPFVYGFFWVSIGWLAGLFIMFPFIQALRLVLEHRPDTLSDDAGASLSSFAAVSRNFGSGPVSSTFGAAGFNRHSLHHWEPQISYTNLYDLEQFFLESELAPILEKETSTYFRTFKNLVKF